MEKTVFFLDKPGVRRFGVRYILYMCISLLVISSCQKNEYNLLSLDNLSEDCRVFNPGTENPQSDGELPDIYFGHRIFKRGYRSPDMEMVVITNPDFNCFEDNFVLRIKNGNGKHSRVSSAVIRIDGKIIAGPSDFSKNVTVITKQLSGLNPESVLEVKLNGTPGSFIDLWIEGEKTGVIPEFDPIGPVCQNSIPPVLPESSKNTPPVKGTWSPSVINSEVVGKAAYTFTPAEGQCATTVTMEIEVTPQIIPTFEQIGPLDQGSIAPALPSTSLNGIAGTWQPSTISTTATGTFTFTFTPSEGQCAIPVTMDIVIKNSGIISDIEGNAYKIIKIGEQWWMAENLKTTKYNNGDIIGTTIPASLDISGETEPKYQWACNGDENNVSIYGRLYTWYTVTDSRGVCPTGWRVSTDADWNMLIGYLTNNGYGYGGSGSDIGKSLASINGWLTDPTPGNVGNDPNTNNSSGFTGVPSGYRAGVGTFVSMGSFAGWWLNAEYSVNYANHADLFSNSNFVTRSSENKRFAGAVRCIKN